MRHARLGECAVYDAEHFDDEYVGDASNQVTEYTLPDICAEPAEANAVGSTRLRQLRQPRSSCSGSLIRFGIKYALTGLALGLTRFTFTGKAKSAVKANLWGFASVTLTTSWTQYSISLAGVSCKPDVFGVQPGSFWQADPASGEIRFAIDDIQVR